MWFMVHGSRPWTWKINVCFCNISAGLLKLRVSTDKVASDPRVHGLAEVAVRGSARQYGNDSHFNTSSRPHVWLVKRLRL